MTHWTALEQLRQAGRIPAGLEPFIAAVYMPLAEDIARAARSYHAPYVVGLCGPQGSGKSTLALLLSALIEDIGLRTAILSLDDLYLTRVERIDLAQRVHPLLLTRGVPGTHDVGLGIRVLDALGSEGNVALPSFDKATDERRTAATWPTVKAPVDVMLFEGWCVGAKPQSTAALIEPVNDLEREFDPDGRWRHYVNEALATGYQSLFARLNRLVLLTPPGFEMVYAWRSEQEQRLREKLEASGGDTSRLMNEVELRRFIAHYERLTRHLLDEMPARADVVIDLDAQRRPRSRI